MIKPELMDELIAEHGVDAYKAAAEILDDDEKTWPALPPGDYTMDEADFGFPPVPS
ncbi:hypothetical protein ABZV65_30910 [Streptomyces bauhiniae]|uniref:hypothetical protein n=1 Tax=Streptomyces bauhiniae TaxID=2340725 RepID=UPI0033AA43BE